MNYSPVKCPSCGSNSVVPSEGGRVYCKSCDCLFEKEKVDQTFAATPDLPEEEKPKGDDLIGPIIVACIVVCVAIVALVFF